MVLARLRRLLPASKLGWTWLITSVLAWCVIGAMIVWVLAPTLADPSALGSHDWDQMESHRYLVDKTILRFHQFPFWNPYACGGHPNWGGFESGTTVVSPWLPFYLTMTLPHAMRVEVWGSALLSAIGAWMLGGRFTRSPAMRALVVVAFTVNGRWALQITSGHTWHLAYLWTPWVLYFFDRAAGIDALCAPRRRDVVLCAACVAMMVYTGGIYPLPETILAVALYGIFLAAYARSARPLLAGAASGALAFGLAAPKLLPVLEVLRKHPRLVDSTETLDLGALVQVLTSRDQDMNSGHAGVSQWGWHEWGMYVGWAIVVAVLLGTIFGRGRRESPLKWAGFVLLSLGLGSFDPHAPWPLLHHLPVFQSQHVPSRWMYPSLLVLLTVTAGTMERVLRRSGALRGWLEGALVLGVAWVAYDIGEISRQPIAHMFTVKMPTVAEATDTFHTEIHLPASMAYTADWAPSSLPAEMGNIGTIDCGTFPALHNYFRDQNGRAPGLGARGRGDPAYKGEAFIPDGVGEASVIAWTPNAMTVAVHGAQAGEHVVLNQNYDEGWSADGQAAANWSDAVAAQLHGSDATIVFRYRPPTFWPGVLLGLATASGIVFLWRRTRGAS
jgi:hypothetical protein